MKPVKLTCSRCGASLVPEDHGDYSSLSCPYCGSSEGMLIESDRIKIARIRAAADQDRLAFMFREHYDRQASNHSRRRIQIVIICIFSLITFILIRLYTAGFSG